MINDLGSRSEIWILGSKKSIPGVPKNSKLILPFVDYKPVLANDMSIE